MRTLMALLCGAMAGMAMGVLCAPESGAATRSRLRDKANHYWHEVTDFAEGKGRHLRNKAKGYTHMAEEALDRGREMIEAAAGRTAESGRLGGETNSKMYSAMDEEEEEAFA